MTLFLSHDARVRWPVIVADGLDVMVFADPDVLSKTIEPVDISEYAVFDSVGQRLELATSGGEVWVRPTEATTGEGPPELAKLLSRFLQACGVKAEETEPLAPLVAEAQKISAQR